MPKTEIDRGLAQAIVDTIQEPLLVLDAALCVAVASRAYYRTYSGDAASVVGQFLVALNNGRWNIPSLIEKLESVSRGEGAFKDHALELTLPETGSRLLHASAERMFYDGAHVPNILLQLEDVTDWRATERERDDLLRQKDMLMEEIQHRVANSLAIIASILLMKARSVASQETRAQLEDAHKRVMSVAAVQKHLRPLAGASIAVAPYLTELCASLAGSMINDESCTIEVRADESRVTSSEAVSVGLIVTELVINALKHAFGEAGAGCVIDVAYEANGTDWKLTVSDNGGGAPVDAWPPAKVGLGTSIVNALAEQLQARVQTESGATGTTVSITHLTFKPLAGRQSPLSASH